jgi:hypothetical protein
MFPDKIDKVVLDGVVNPFEYYTNTYVLPHLPVSLFQHLHGDWSFPSSEVELFTDTAAAFSGFCSGCVEAPEACPLGRNMTATQLEESLYAAMESLKSNPLPIPSPDLPGGGFLLDYSTVKALIYGQLYFPSLWPDLANTIAAALFPEMADGGSSAGLGSLGGAPSTVSRDQEALAGIKCSDVLGSGKSLAEMLPVFSARHQISRFGDVADEVPARCAQWGLPAKERYDGDFRVKTQNPVLLIGNTFDPVTPLASARNLSQTLENSVLLQHDSYGVSFDRRCPPSSMPKRDALSPMRSS